MIVFIRKIFPELNPAMHIIMGYIYDTYKFLKASTDFSPESSKNKLSALITRQSHGVEKAFSLPNPRLGFGVILVETLVNNTTIYYKLYGYDHLVSNVLDNLITYLEFHQNYNEISLKKLKTKISILVEQVIEYVLDNKNKTGGHILITREEWLQQLKKFDFKNFCETRMSIRDFSDKEIEENLIEQAIVIAMKSPSACNRQPWRVRIFKEEKKNYILKYQNGNRGFSESINTILLITGLSSSFSYSERHSVWVDCGLFSMSLIYALHSLDLGVCALNTSYTVKGERALRKVTNIPLDEEPIMMLAIGHLKNNFTVTMSARKQLSEVLIKD